MEYLSMGQWIKFPFDDIMDWYLLSDSGELEGGFSFCYQRSLLTPENRAKFDEYIGVEKYLEA
ncbi:MAG: DUF2314 domain-containing protein [Promethearchaeota archaeon]